MSLKFPITRYRPAKTADGEGGFTEVLGAGITIYGIIQIHQNKTSLLCDPNEDVKVNDVLVAATAQYRAGGSMLVPGTRWRSVELERIERPIVPL